MSLESQAIIFLLQILSSGAGEHWGAIEAPLGLWAQSKSICVGGVPFPLGISKANGKSLCPPGIMQVTEKAGA